MDTHFRSCLRDPCRCDIKRYWLILAIASVIILIEILGAIVSNSLALLSDAVHVLTDAGAISVAIIAEHIGNKKPGRRNFARKLGAFVNAILILGIVVFLVLEAIERIESPRQVIPLPLIIVAIIGAVGNYWQAQILESSESEHEGHDALHLHILSDLWQSCAVILGAFLILIFNQPIIDSIISLVIAAAMTVWSLRLLYKIFTKKEINPA
ncbi:MAG: transporter of the cation diffusion facilitator family [Parcubacteria group bacterium Gr01-1014_3]|nr:MAG: transporter of the cation diffusion facilitator family [Parcubacteria group bacterium Gr01-1014_3]